MSESSITKKAMAESIKELMKQKSLEKITVTDIVQNCGLNRQTFYYHFKDKYDLVSWIYYNEVVLTLSQASTDPDWSTVILRALNVMKRGKNFYTRALNVTGQNIFYDYFFRETKEMLLKIVNQLADSVKEGHDIKDADKLFIAEFYTYGLVGMIIQWARNGMKEPPNEIADRLKHFIDDGGLLSAARCLKEIDRKKAADK
mgnify:CR=1 FL=1|jgi:probable dihydroxyacetone kinase regulator